MILVWGSPADPPVAAVLDALDDLSADVELLDDATVPALAYDLVVGPRPSGWLELGDRQVDLDEITAVYLRPGEQPRSGTPTSAALLAVLGSLPATVVNRPAAGRSNLAKPFQLAALAAAGLAIPDTLVTTDPGAARDFLARHRRIVYKSISGVRSVVASINARDPAGVERLDRLGHGPVQLQQWIDGTDVRVHVVGDRWFATSITAEATDYRYASDGTAPPELAPCDLPDDLGRRLVDVSHGMGLLVSGVDLRRTADESWCCFEINPSPGFTYYEGHTGQPIAGAIAALLTGPVIGAAAPRTARTWWSDDAAPPVPRTGVP